MPTLIRCHIMWRLIWVFTVCSSLFYRFPGNNGLKRKIIIEFANTVDPHETLSNQPSYLDLHCLSSTEYSLYSQYESFKSFKTSGSDLLQYSKFLEYTLEVINSTSHPHFQMRKVALKES